MPLNKAMLKWARDEAGLKPPEVATLSNIKGIKARGFVPEITPAMRIQMWEKGEETPSFDQLESLAKAYRRPLLTFYLKEPPKKSSQLKDFRTVGNNAPVLRLKTPIFSALVRQSELLQRNLRDLVQQDEIEHALDFVSSIKLETPQVDAVQMIREKLNFSFVDQCNVANSDKLFSVIRERIENLGVYVVLKGNLGSYHTDLDSCIFRGLALSDTYAPLIVINPNDTKSARLFSLLHEFCHILFGKNSISNWGSLNIDNRSSEEIENYCDSIAAEFLVPKDTLVEYWFRYTKGNTKDVVINKLARRFKVSEIVVARRLLDNNFIQKKEYWDFYDRSINDFFAHKKALKNKKARSGPPYGKMKLYEFGNKTISTIGKAISKNRISEVKATRILGIRARNYDTIFGSGIA